MEKLDGAPLIDLDAIRNVTTADPERVLISALNTWFGSLLGAETFHADVHAGNQHNSCSSNSVYREFVGVA